MEPNARLRKSVRGVYAWLGSLLVALFAALVAERLIESRVVGVRMAGVLVGTVGWIPMILMIVLIVRAADEFARRMHLIAIAAAFTVFLVLLTLLDWLARGQFLEPPPLRVLWLGAAVLYFICILITKRYFERES